ncbi:PREDICTED: pectinesterase-like [Tarenaya hassleriana]|uniref:pectinesterase-like n=1 Tax=Tarenaya hassleriana TaxID=28532 RepID=UPI00053C1F95|nr:PREDICTED: pectinesterase-like [Tarenaya hassleriana]
MTGINLRDEESMGSFSTKMSDMRYDISHMSVTGDHFLAQDITFENTAGAVNEQAVALRVGAQKSAFYHCGFSAYQDTLYVHSKRQFFRNCFVAGTVDFIFGNSAVVLQNCDIEARIPGKGKQNMVTAQGRIDKNQDTGIVIQKYCRMKLSTPRLISGP